MLVSKVNAACLFKNLVNAGNEEAFVASTNVGSFASGFLLVSSRAL